MNGRSTLQVLNYAYHDKEGAISSPFRESRIGNKIIALAVDDARQTG
ncbi:MAG: hypothetical protein J7540_22405 [Roseofilum sp. SID2]|nr:MULTISPECIES: hypothetical protein [unclassified Roseofilum]MBP0014102.1 hypothetical protein [Roseofilum sp. SID3]MBP0026727.1 hypothetical protein [Roseofilum sp. SID2]MBP0036288.1 hypothetical protein [Roseofilum sp. SID1]